MTTTVAGPGKDTLMLELTVPADRWQGLAEAQGVTDLTEEQAAMFMAVAFNQRLDETLGHWPQQCATVCQAGGQWGVFLPVQDRFIAIRRVP